MAPPGWFPDSSGSVAERCLDVLGRSEDYLTSSPAEMLRQVSATSLPDLEIRGPDSTIHLILTVLTLGLWLPFWAAAVIAGKQRITYC